jgi:hypothetical protein
MNCTFSKIISTSLAVLSLMSAREFADKNVLAAGENKTTESVEKLAPASRRADVWPLLGGASLIVGLGGALLYYIISQNTSTDSGNFIPYDEKDHACYADVSEMFSEGFRIFSYGLFGGGHYFDYTRGDGLSSYKLSMILNHVVIMSHVLRKLKFFSKKDCEQLFCKIKENFENYFQILNLPDNLARFGKANEHIGNGELQFNTHCYDGFTLLKKVEGGATYRLPNGTVANYIDDENIKAFVAFISHLSHPYVELKNSFESGDERFIEKAEEFSYQLDNFVAMVKALCDNSINIPRYPFVSSSGGIL